MVSGLDRFLTTETGEFSPDLVKELFFPDFIYYRNKQKFDPYGLCNFKPALYEPINLDDWIGWTKPKNLSGNSLRASKNREKYVKLISEALPSAFVGSGAERSLYICKKGVEIHRVVVGDNDETVRVLSGKKHTGWGETRKETNIAETKLVLGLELDASVYRAKRKTQQIPQTHSYTDRQGVHHTYEYSRRERSGVWLKAQKDNPSSYEKGTSFWQQKQADRTEGKVETWFEKQWGFRGRPFISIGLSNSNTRNQFSVLVPKTDKWGIVNWIGF
jgi:hypothetical protein